MQLFNIRSEFSNLCIQQMDVLGTLKVNNNSDSNNLIYLNQQMSCQFFQSRYQRNKALTFIGSLMIQFASGVIPVWGNSNIYYLSYFKNHGQNVTQGTNSKILIATVIPMACLVIFSTKLSNKFGFTFVIKIGSIIFLLSQFIAYMFFTLPTMVLFLLIIPISSLSISIIPMYNCLWSYFLQKKNLITAYVLVSFGIGAVIFNVMFLHIVNPHNQQAVINSHGQGYFKDEVTNNLPLATKVIFLLAGFMFCFGAFLVHKQSQKPSQTNKNQQNNNENENFQKHFQLKEEVQFDIQQPNNMDRSKQQSKNQNSKQKQRITQTELKSPQLKQMQIKDQFSPATLTQNHRTDSSQNLQPQAIISIMEHLKDTRFLIIFFTTLVIDFYIVFLINNVKLIFISAINDDHFLGYTLIANTVTAILGTFIWGYVADKKGIAKTMLILAIVDTIIKFFGIFASDKPTLFILMFSIGLTSRGMMTIAGPGLIQIFGLKIATQLLPFKALAVIGSFICVPVLQLITLNVLSSKHFLNFLVIFNLVVLGMVTTFYKKYGKNIQEKN